MKQNPFDSISEHMDSQRLEQYNAINMFRTLIVEPDRKLSQAIAQTLPQNSFHAYTTTKYSHASKMLDRFNFALLLLTFTSAFSERCFQLIKKTTYNTSRTNNPKIIVLIAKIKLSNKIELLKLGVSDFIYKPLKSIELIYHIQNVLQLRDSADGNLLRYNSQIFLNVDRSELYLYDSKTRLTKNEMELIQLLFKQHGFAQRDTLKKTLSKLSNHCLNTKLVTDNYLNVIIRRLRKKLVVTSGTPLIKTHYGTGYYLNAKPN